MCDVLLNSFDKVFRFANIMSSLEIDAYLSGENAKVCAKSLLGIFSMDLTRPLQLTIVPYDGHDVDYYMSKISEFIVGR